MKSHNCTIYLDLPAPHGSPLHLQNAQEGPATGLPSAEGDAEGAADDLKERRNTADGCEKFILLIV